MDEKLLAFAQKVMELKEVRRTGWLLKGIRESESVADHSFMLAFMAYVYSRELGIDTDKCIRMALVHDICEVYTGDITTRFREEDQDVSNLEKRRKEREALEKIVSPLPKEIARELKALWEEFDKCDTKEARLVKDLDRLEMCIQALSYAGRKEGKLQEFFDVADRDIKTPGIRKLFGKVCSEFRKIKGFPEKNRDVI